MNISLTPQLEELVKRKVDSGLYVSASEVMREALRLLEERDRLNAMRLEELKAEIKKGLDSGEATHLDIGVIKARGRKRLAAQAIGDALQKIPQPHRSAKTSNDLQP